MYAWSENAGWQNFRPTTYGGVTVFAGHLSGYVWAENIGYIKLGSSGGGGTPYYANTNSTNWGVNRSGDNLSGYGWSENAGWINFRPTTYGGVAVDSITGKFYGYAWSENVGWINFQNDSPAYNVRTDNPTAVELVSFRAAPTPASIVLEWETASEIDITGFNLWRKTLKEPDYTRIAEVPIQGAFPLGAEYAYEDTDVFPGITYKYQLEDVHVTDQNTRHGPVSATIGDIVAVGPEDGEKVPVRPRPSFSWSSEYFDRFRLEFSKNPDFKPARVVVAPMPGTGETSPKTAWINDLSYTLKAREWQAVRQLAKKTGTVYWRVVGKNKTGSTFRSEARLFHLDAAAGVE
jgi:hypothetical protein